MTDYRKEYISRKNTILALMQDAVDYMHSHGFEKEAKLCSDWKKALQTEQFSIALIGEFSAGKSTFLNALLHEKLLPSFTRETTATLTILRHSTKSLHGEQGRVYYKDGTEKEIPTVDGDTIAKYVCTESTEDVAGQISHFDIFIENKFLEDNVILVDTPGLNSLKRGHEELTREQIERSNASIYVFNANQPGKATDFKILAELRSKVPQIFFVLNRIDDINCNENETVDDIIHKLQENYLKEFSSEVKPPVIYPISAFQALVARSSKPLSYRQKSGFSAEEKAKMEISSSMQPFEERLWQFLTQGEKGRQMLLDPADRLKKKLTDIMDIISNNIDLYKQNPNAEEIETQISSLRKAIEELERSSKNSESTIKNAILAAESEFMESIRAQSIELQQKMFDSITQFTSLDDIDPQKIMKEIDRKMNMILGDAYHDYAARIEQAMVECSGKMCANLPYDLFERIHIKLDRKLELTELDTGGDAFDQKIMELRSQADALEEELDRAEGDILKQKRMERKRDELQRKIDAEAQAKKWYLDNAQAAMPSVVRYNKPEVRAEDRQGFFGKIAQVLVGQKQVVIDVNVVDRSERDEYQARMDKISQQYDEDIAELRRKLDGVEDADSELAQQQLRAIERKLQKKHEEQAALMRDFKENLEKNYQKQLRIQKRETEEYIESATEELIQLARKQFDEQKKAQIAALMTLITAPFRDEIERQQTELEMLRSKANSAENERLRKLHEMEQAQTALRPLLSQAMDLYNELEAIPVITMETDGGNG